jgi:hypothetical protein
VSQADDASFLVVEDLVGLRKVVLPKQPAHSALRLVPTRSPLAQLLSAHLPQPEPPRRTRGLCV